jgi:small conductance mechanosensitive channel
MQWKLNWLMVGLLVVFAGFTALAQEESGGADAPPEAKAASTADETVPAGGGEAAAEESAAPIESQEDAEAKVDEVTEDVKKKGSEAISALASGDVGAAADKGMELFTTYGIPAIAAIVIIMLAYFVATFLARIASRPICRRVDETLGRFVGKMVFYLVMICALLGVLQYFGIGVASFAAVLAAAGFAVGLAFQGTLSNFAAGVMLLVFRPFKVGDVINAAGVTAKVYEIDLFHTVFDTPDNRRIIVPNSEVGGGTIENISHHAERRVDVSVGVDYAASLDRTREVLTAAAEALEDKMVAGDGRGFQIVLGDLGDSAVTWTVRFWTKAEDFWSVKEQLTYAVKTKLDEAGIGIPFPQLDVHVLKQVD